MKLWRVNDVMSKDVVSVTDDMPYRDLVEVMVGRRVSAVPVLTRAGQVVGVVSETDLLHKVESAGDRQMGMVFSPRRRAERAKAAGITAVDLMTRPAVTVAPSLAVPAAARRMHQEGVKWMPVIAADGGLAGVVTRGDLLKVYLSSDAEIRRAVVDEVLGPIRALRANAVVARSTNGVVTLSGQVEFRSVADQITRRSRRVPGVVGVVSELQYEVDDSMVTGSRAGTPFGVA